MTDHAQDPNTPATPQAGEAAQPPAGTDTPTTPLAGDANQPTITSDTQALIDAAAKKASQEANREAKSLRDRLKAFEDAEQARKDADLTEAERLTKERDAANTAAAEAQQHAQAAMLRAEVATLATSPDLNIVDVDAALTLMARDGIEFNDGKVTGVADALKQLVAAKPFLVAAPGTPRLDPTNGARQAGAKDTPSDAERLARIVNPNHGNIWAR